MDNDQYLTLTQAAKLCPGRPHSSSIWRWCVRGVVTRPGTVVKLQFVKAGRRLFTTRTFLDQFLVEGAEAHAEQFADSHRAASPTARKSTAKQRQASIEQANTVLRNAGIIE